MYVIFFFVTNNKIHYVLITLKEYYEDFNRGLCACDYIPAENIFLHETRTPSAYFVFVIIQYSILLFCSIVCSLMTI